MPCVCIQPWPALRLVAPGLSAAGPTAQPSAARPLGAKPEPRRAGIAGDWRSGLAQGRPTPGARALHARRVLGPPSVPEAYRWHGTRQRGRSGSLARPAQDTSEASVPRGGAAKACPKEPKFGGSRARRRLDQGQAPIGDYARKYLPAAQCLWLLPSPRFDDDLAPKETANTQHLLAGTRTLRSSGAQRSSHPQRAARAPHARRAGP